MAQACQQENLAASMAEYGPSTFIKQKLAEIEARGRELARERRELEALQKRALELPESTTALRAMLEAGFATLADDSFEFGDLLRKMVPGFHVYLVRLCDGGHLLPRVKVQFALDGLIPDARHVPGLAKLTSREATLDLFVPPQRERIREQAVRLAGEGLTAKEIAKRIAEGTTPTAEKPTATAVQNALALERKMRDLGLSSPYVTMLAPPDDYPKLRRHRNAKYRFTPMPEYRPPAL